MSRICVLAVCLAAVLTVPGLAADDDAAAPMTSAPGILGPTGAIITPTTELPPLDGYNLGFHVLNDTLDAAAKVNVSPIKRLELGGIWYAPADNTLDDEFLFNAKYVLVEESDKAPALAVGVADIADEVDQTWYGVVSKRWDGQVPIVVNIGGASGETIDGVFGSVKLELHEDVDVIGEYDSSELNFGIRCRPYEGLTLDLMTVDNRTDRVFGFGASYSASW
jgi:hypothetical protein